MALILTVLAVGALLVLNELWVRRMREPSELSRKFVHITVGSFVAFWPFFLTRTQIIALSVAFVLVVGASKYFNIFTAIHSVQRPTFGELFFGFAVGITALLTASKGIYAVALLQMSLADGLAAVMGQHFGRSNRYKILGNTKSVVGTATFIVVSVALLIGFRVCTGMYVAPVIMVAIAGSAALLENLGAYGLDNVLVPVMIAIVLSV